MRYTTCLVHGLPVAGIAQNPDPDATDFWWNVYLATDNCDDTAKRITDAVVAQAAAAGGTSSAPEDFGYGRMATITDPFGTEFSVIARPPVPRS
jgi:predicted enzyme related to lactoylglutathione lyase